jgi:hypothetical protein
MSGLVLGSLRDPLEENILPRLVLPVPPDFDVGSEESSANFRRGQSPSSVCFTADGGNWSRVDDFVFLLGEFSCKLSEDELAEFLPKSKSVWGGYIMRDFDFH